MQTLVRNVTLPLPLRLRALPEIDTNAILKTNGSFQIENSLRRTIWFEFHDDEPDLPRILSEYFFKTLSDVPPQSLIAKVNRKPDVLICSAGGVATTMFHSGVLLCLLGR